MLQKPEDYDTAESYDSDFPRLKAGGYVCKILKMRECTAATGAQYVHISFDIAEGEYEDFFLQQYRRKESAGRDAKWRGTYNVFPLTRDNMTNPRWKGFLTCVEKSNDGFHVNWSGDYGQFTNKLVGLLFREEEYERTIDGAVKVFTAVRACAARPAEIIRYDDFMIPRKKELPVKAQS